jgi:hypothetical protein
VDPILIPILAVASVPIVAIGLPIARALARRIEAQASRPSVPSDVSARLARMEQALDAIAVEVERISEAQRFTTKLLAEAAQPSAGALGAAAPDAGRAAARTPI